MRLLLTGATGMIGGGTLLECLDDPEITEVRSVVRRPSGRVHDKLTEIVLADFADWSPIADQLAGLDACLWCLGVSAGGMSEEDYRRVTVGFTKAGAEAMLAASPGLVICFISGSGTDRGARAMWARTKAEAEDLLLGMDFGRAVMFRPALIQPLRGVVSRTRSYRLMYSLMGWSFPLWRLVAGKMVTDSVTLGRAMIHAAKHDGGRSILENHEINALRGRADRTTSQTG